MKAWSSSRFIQMLQTWTRYQTGQPSTSLNVTVPPKAHGLLKPQVLPSETQTNITASGSASTTLAKPTSFVKESNMSLALILTALQAVPSLFTVIDSAVQSVESSLSDVPGVSGSTKLQAAETKVNAFLTAAGTDIATVTSLSGVLTPLINASVSIFNAAGLFKHAANPAPVAA